MKFYTFKIIIESENDSSGYFAYSADLPGCYSNGPTIEETRQNMQQAIEQHVMALLEKKQTLPEQKYKQTAYTEFVTIALPVK